MTSKTTGFTPTPRWTLIKRVALAWLVLGFLVFIGAFIYLNPVSAEFDVPRGPRRMLAAFLFSTIAVQLPGGIVTMMTFAENPKFRVPRGEPYIEGELYPLHNTRRYVEIAIASAVIPATALIRVPYFHNLIMIGLSFSCAMFGSITMFWATFGGFGIRAFLEGRLGLDALKLTLNEVWLYTAWSYVFYRWVEPLSRIPRYIAFSAIWWAIWHFTLIFMGSIWNYPTWGVFWAFVIELQFSIMSICFVANCIGLAAKEAAEKAMVK